MRDDAMHGGKNAYDSVVATLESDQGGICAYCEIKISRTTNTIRVEHFVPKVMQHPKHPKFNWTLHWFNLIGVCNGGTELRSAPGHFLEPVKENLSCDAHKEQTLGAVNSHGWLLNPLALPSMRPLLKIHRLTGHWIVCRENADTTRWPGNRYASTEALVEKSIDILNLNCSRLVRNRLKVLHNLEKELKRAREARLDPAVYLVNLCRRYLNPKYSEFFSVYRSRLGSDAEAYLHSISFNG
jgi:uncharacterized protein (TIGR02646 family)